jgi:hypothetical protein
MHGSGRAHGWLVHLLAGAALGAVVVLLVWIFSGGRPFGEVVGTGDVSAPTPAAAERAPEAPADKVSRLAAEPPAMGSAPGELQFRKPKAKAERPATAKRPAKPRRAAKPTRAAKARTPRRAPARRRPPAAPAPAPVQPAEELPVAAVPSPAPTAVPAPPAPAPAGGADKPAKRRAPAYVVGAGEG